MKEIKAEKSLKIVAQVESCFRFYTGRMGLMLAAIIISVISVIAPALSSEGICHDKFKSCRIAEKYGYCLPVKAQDNFQVKGRKKAVKSVCKKSCGFCQCGVPAARQLARIARITSGTAAIKGNYPWQAALYHKSKFFCGGTLISSRYVLTAAHCLDSRVDGVKDFEVVLGDHLRNIKEGTEKTFSVESFKIHEDYKDPTDDLALIKLAKDVEFTKYISPACLPAHTEQLKAGTKCFVTGWGSEYAGGKPTQVLNYFKLNIIDGKSCQDQSPVDITDRMLCAMPSDYSFGTPCHYDSGGPFVCEHDGVFTLHGVVNFGEPQCNGMFEPSVYAKVSMYKEWIRKNTK